MCSRLLWSLIRFGVPQILSLKIYLSMGRAGGGAQAFLPSVIRKLLLFCFFQDKPASQFLSQVSVYRKERVGERNVLIRVSLSLISARTASSRYVCVFRRPCIKLPVQSSQGCASIARLNKPNQQWTGNVSVDRLRIAVVAAVLLCCMHS